VKVVAVILNWRRAEETIACARSVRETSPETEIIVVDNASGDGSAGRIRAALPGVEVLETEHNLGYTGGNNVGMQAALDQGADALFVLNSDVLIQPGCIQALSHVAEDLHKEYHCLPLAPISLRTMDPSIVDFYRARVDLRNMALIAEGRGEPSRALVDAETDYVTGSALFAHRQLFEHIDLFDERFFLVWEDVDLCLRARRAGCAGHKAEVVAEAVVHHGGGTSFGPDRNSSPLYQYFFVRNSFLIVRKHVGWPFRARTLRMIEQRYRGWVDKAEPAVARAIALGIEHGLAQRYGPPPPELMPLDANLPPA